MRSFHGTGVGTSTNDGFWIPGPPPEKEPSPEPLPPPAPKEKKAPRRVGGQKPKATPTAVAGGSKVTRSASGRGPTAVAADGQPEEEPKPKPAPARRSKPAKKEEEDDGPPKVILTEAQNMAVPSFQGMSLVSATAYTVKCIKEPHARTRLFHLKVFACNSHSLSWGNVSESFSQSC